MSAVCICNCRAEQAKLKTIACVISKAYFSPNKPAGRNLRERLLQNHPSTTPVAVGKRRLTAVLWRKADDIMVLTPAKYVPVFLHKNVYINYKMLDNFTFMITSKKMMKLIEHLSAK